MKTWAQCTPSLPFTPVHPFFAEMPDWLVLRAED